MKKLRKKEQLGHNFSYPSSSVAVVFGGHLSAQAAFRLDRPDGKVVFGNGIIDKLSIN